MTRYRVMEKDERGNVRILSRPTADWWDRRRKGGDDQYRFTEEESARLIRNPRCTREPV